ncbi:hypothetical protein AB0N05_31025 [Nocardia sp. NPDC051030]|uniref:hypothetical protein n=1 Tax=Nocardia sp. NPDC051030 TaxID=3155162 RepID=UPI003426FDCE
MTVAALAGCSRQPDAAAPPDPDTADCTAGSRTVGQLQSTFRDLSDQLNGIAPASDRGDTAEVGQRLQAAARLSATIDADFGTATDTMASPLSRRAFTAVADAGAALHDALTQLAQAIDGSAPATTVPDTDAVGSVQRSLQALNTSVEGMRLSCSTVLADSTIAPRPAPGPQPVSGPGIERQPAAGGRR